MSGQTALVTGVAGFIGSATARRLLDDGWRVVGVDCLTDYYDAAQKRANLATLEGRDGFAFRQDDLAITDVGGLVDGADAVIHLAGQPGVRASWGASFAPYLEMNVLVTQRLLEAARVAGVDRFVYASSSSVYGRAERYPTRETDLPAPISPYGVTKLGGEHLARLYAANFGVPTVSLRYFTVFGPGQRPDMAMHKLIRSALMGTPFPLYGDGSAVRDFTFIGDVVDANVRAATRPGVEPGTVLNIGGGSDGITMRGVIDVVAREVGVAPRLERHKAMPGDPARTGADTARAREVLGWVPGTDVVEGIARQAAWQRHLLSVTA